MTWTNVTEPSSSWSQSDYMRVKLGDKAPLDGTILLGGSLNENTYSVVTPISDTSWSNTSNPSTTWS